MPVSATLLAERAPLVGRFVRKNARRFPANVRYGDIRRRLPVPDRSCAAVYASHVLEHLALDDFHHALDETYRILAPGGVFCAVVPDLEHLAITYLDRLRNGDAAGAAPAFVGKIGGWRTRPRGLYGFVWMALRGTGHRWMWDYPSLSAALCEHGFAGIRRAAFGDSAEPAFRAVEDPGRFERAVAVEAVRPT